MNDSNSPVSPLEDQDLPSISALCLPESKEFPNAWDKEYRYRETDTILVLGELDFSLSVAIYGKIPCAKMISTALYSSADAIPFRCRATAKANIKTLKAMKCEVQFGVDATTVTSEVRFDKIVFAFPRDGFRYRHEDIQRQHRFLENIIKQLSNVLIRSETFRCDLTKCCMRTIFTYT